jgi:phage head maturation protease
MTTGAGLAMKVKLRELMNQHQVRIEPRVLPLAPATGCPMILKGYAATVDVDAERTRFAPHAFGLLRASQVKLLYRHDPTQIAGEVQDLCYDARGNLCIVAKVTHERAQRCGGFSIGGRVRSFKLHNANSKDFFAVVDDLALEEISLTETPANMNAVVQSRFPVNAHAEMLGHASQYFRTLQQLVALLPQAIASSSPAPNPSAPSMRKFRPQVGDTIHGEPIWSDCFPQRRPAPRSRPKTSFGELADHLNRMEA